MSGIGRDGGDYSFDFYMETKNVCRLRHPPGTDPGEIMSLYQVQKFLRPQSTNARRRVTGRARGLLAEYELTAEEAHALREGDIGLLYVLGVNGQILMHFAAFSASPGSTISTSCARARAACRCARACMP